MIDGFFAEVLRVADSRGLLSREHFSGDGTLIQAWASQKSFRPKDGGDDQTPGGGGRMRKRTAKGSRAAMTPTAAPRIRTPGTIARAITRQRCSLGVDKAYDTSDFVAGCRECKVTPHVVAAKDTRRGGSAIDGRTTRHSSYRLSQLVRKRIEEHFGWARTIGRIRQTVFRGLGRVDQQFKLTLTASNLMRLARIPVVVPSGAMT